MSTKIYIIVKMGMNKKNAKRFHVDKNITVGEFKKQIVDLEGVAGVQLVYKAKPLAKDNVTLASLGCHNGCTMFCSQKLIGGTGNHNINQPLDEPEGGSHTFNDETVRKFDGVVVTSHCVIGTSTGCYTKEIKKAKVPCGCIFCPDCMRKRVDHCSANSYRICCVGSKGHTKDIPLEMALAIAGYTQKEADEMQSQITGVWMSLFMRTCPNAKCGSFVYKGDDLGKVNRVRCPTCKAFDYCWYCSEKWVLGGMRICGNANCDPVANLMGSLQECELKTIANYGKTIENVPSIRLCTNKKCSIPNYHVTKCKHMTCNTCGKQYCQSCLKDWNKCGLQIKCVPAPTQEVTMDMIRE